MEEPEVVVYSTPDCRYCAMARAYLGGKGIKFTEYNVAEDKEKAQEMVNKSGQMAVPVIEINGRIMVGFDRGAVDAALAKPKPPKRDEFMSNLFYDPFHV